MVRRSRGIKPKEGDSIAKLLAAFIRQSDESALGRLIVEVVILLSARSQPDVGKVLKAAAHTYKVDADAVALKIKQDIWRRASFRGHSLTTRGLLPSHRAGKPEGCNRENG